MVTSLTCPYAVSRIAVFEPQGGALLSDFLLWTTCDRTT